VINMGKFISVTWKIIFLIFWMPLYKVVSDFFTAPETGLFVTSGMNDAGLAFWTAVPWILPIIVVIWLIIDLRKPNEPKGGSGINFPGG